MGRYNPTDPSAAVSVAAQYPDVDSATDEAPGGFPAIFRGRVVVRIIGSLSSAIAPSVLAQAIARIQLWDGSGWQLVAETTDNDTDGGPWEYVLTNIVLDVLKVRCYAYVAGGSDVPLATAVADSVITNWYIEVAQRGGIIGA